MNIFLILAAGALESETAILMASLLLYSRKQHKNDKCRAVCPGFQLSYD